MINQIECLALTLFDVLDAFDEIPICVAYEHEGRRYDVLPADISVLRSCRPIWEVLPGWKADTSPARRFEDLPEPARRYVRRIEETVGCEIGIISTSPQRDGTIILPRGRIAKWLPVRQAVRAGF
jgi:adenylosuccinate synthase